MRGLAGILLAAGSAAALVGMANAQPVGGGPQAVLFDQPNFQGPSITVVEGAPDLGRWGFAGRAMSARFEGDWTVCDAPDLDGRCATVGGNVADLSRIGAPRILSLGEASQDATQAAAAGPDSAARLVPANAPAGKAAAPPTPVAPKAGAPPTQLASAGPRDGSAAAATDVAVQGEAGRGAVFFAKPTRGGAEVAIDVQGPANQFCHDQGLGAAVYFDTDGHVLRDVLCRRS